MGVPVDMEEFTAFELVDRVYVRMELLEGILARAARSGDSRGWVYQAMDVIEQIYDHLSALKKRIEECGGCRAGSSAP